MHLHHHSGDIGVKPFVTENHRCGDSIVFTAAVKFAVMKHPNRMKELREARGLSLQALADAVNSSPQQMNRLERGERRLSDHWMALIAPVLGVEPWELLPGAPPRATSDEEKGHFFEIFNALDGEHRRTLETVALGLLAAQQAKGPPSEDDDDHPR
ncbi:helix-turn-helix domain-containing protein [Azospirillum picis]|uniref:Transcriptional regulator with XRE-family HTH domain n=1 Tax=Azospirillum picis TaxID=488438 RepID=A0ABU0MPH8_9PROT|nr:helix-turn-helix transcriptional regulator [Azospirillum picis]MBP2301538.1 transcriptional regulator with XRE-family HTH domain [Azospirillum picis]MDQ0535370.1 transcriptional regulator with XRE-family HTH domain [Azospirillum picis]